MRDAARKKPYKVALQIGVLSCSDACFRSVISLTYASSKFRHDVHRLQSEHIGQQESKALMSLLIGLN